MEKSNIGSNNTPKTALVTQDFSQIQFEGEFCQDFIVCIYTHEKDGLKRVYKHHILYDVNNFKFLFFDLVQQERRILALKIP